MSQLRKKDVPTHIYKCLSCNNEDYVMGVGELLYTCKGCGASERLTMGTSSIKFKDVTNDDNGVIYVTIVDEAKERQYTFGWRTTSAGRRKITPANMCSMASTLPFAINNHLAPRSWKSTAYGDGGEKIEKSGVYSIEHESTFDEENRDFEAEGGILDIRVAKMLIFMSEAQPVA